MIQERARRCQFWSPRVRGARNEYFPRLNEVGMGEISIDAHLAAFEMSCRNFMAAWRAFDAPGAALPLFERIPEGEDL